MWHDLHDEIRTLSNASIHNLTHISNVAQFPTLRIAMYAYAIEYLGLSGEFYMSFAEQIRIKDTLVRMIMGEADKPAYIDCIAELKLVGTIPKDAIILYVTQLFDKEERYLGAWITYQHAHTLTLDRVGIEANWDIVLLKDIQSAHAWALKKAPKGYVFSVYAVHTVWPRVFVGERNA